MKRFAILIVAILVAAAAPARAWCEATCLMPADRASESAKPHCPSHDHSSSARSWSAADTADCPIVDAARPVPAKIVLASPAAITSSHPAPSASGLIPSSARRRVTPVAPQHLTAPPLRV